MFIPAKERKMQRVLMLSISAAMITFGGSGFGYAQPVQLNGTYNFTGTYTCIHLNRFEQDRVVALEIFAVQGSATFNSDGTGKEGANTIGFEFNTSSLVGGAKNGSSYGFSFKYFAGGGYWSIEASGPVEGEGPNGIDFTITDPPGFWGPMSQNGNTLMATPIRPMMEFVRYANGEIIARICTGSRVYILQ
jgi:hypothetical protein